MPNSPRVSGLVPVLAVAAVSIAALGATLSWSLQQRGEPAPQAAARQVQRPAADAPVRVVKAPPSAERVQQPRCPGCVVLRSSEPWL